MIVEVQQKGKKIHLDVEKNSNLLHVLRNQDIPINAICSGSGTCGKCRVQVISGECDISEADRKFLTDEELNDGFRLACTLSVQDDLVIALDDDSQRIEILTTQESVVYAFSPIVQETIVEPAKPSIADQRPHVERIQYELGGDYQIGLGAIRKLDANLQEVWQSKHDSLQVLCHGNTIIDTYPGGKARTPMGIALDIGSTTVAAYLFNLMTGDLISVKAKINPQHIYGADVISRIKFSTEHETGTEILHKQLSHLIDRFIWEFIEEQGLLAEDIRAISVCSNTVINHFLLNLPSESIAQAPFIPITLAAQTLRAEDLDIESNAFVSVLPGIASYVGSDIVAGILSSGMSQSESWTILLDLGTNGEIALGHKDRILVCSAAAGPAFEGASIKHGSSAVPGAISKVDFSQDPLYQTIGNKKAKSICGSGVLDSIAQLVKYGLVDEAGRIQSPDEIADKRLAARLRENKGMEFVLAGDVDDADAITFTAKDVSEIQLAKSAIRAGIEVLLEQAGITYDDISTIFIAGGFGNYMDIASAATIGLIPKELEDRTIGIGNSAASGAAQYLLSEEARKEALRIAEISEYTELSGLSEFTNQYMLHMSFE